ncbi:hypothetical protein SELR_22130 [Selenomonas ruminantium subsp. lactilytica TAM6421]|uniref:DUF4127 family protein n=1 Tax=Selenomonas ruminantium subsp. lactilytica (strain NBRC 103574 / TAM6421) TaxID=927704 RepID=I0GT34_SELRL|nr:DUF4127 family protein [Selenomonas ruminantium]BAL83921.1 hypothetical protein SELR_22130 [Selenomonas ruminantium subsp. lactilytica TAM6421]
MKRIYILIFLVLGLAFACWHYALHPAVPAGTIIQPNTPSKSILLIPLDGRPPCRQFVIDAGAIAGYAVNTPPSELQDYYSAPGDTAGMRKWLQENLPQQEAAIISIDQLLYGGLLAAREKEATPAQQDELIAFLRQLHQENPNKPLLAFSILPRQTPQDTIDGYQEKKDLLAYSRLKGRQYAGLPVDEGELSRLEQAISPQNMQKYLQHFDENEALNRKLIALVKEGVLTRLVLGQDDGEEYSIPNIAKAHLWAFMQQEGLPEDKAVITHGADEIALTMLTAYQNESAGYQPAIYIAYNHPATAGTIMPYMAIDMATVAREKIDLSGGREAASPDEADLILYLSANDYEQDTVSLRARNVQELKGYLNQSKHIALVDLSKHFMAQETLLPLLLAKDIPLNALTAYAGWNTASNAVGTATASASLYLSAQKNAQSPEEALGTMASNIHFLQNRILEDYFYLKEDIDTVNHTLKKAGYRNTADLDLEHNWRWANSMLQESMQKHLAAYKQSKALKAPVRIDTPQGAFTVFMDDLTMELSFPWPRTFEIYLETTPYLYQTSTS